MTLRELIEKEIAATEEAISVAEINANSMRGQVARLEEDVRFRRLHVGELKRMLKEASDGVAG